MKRFKIKHLAGSFVCALLLLGISAPLFFTSCENEHPEITITLESDFSGIIEAINNTNKTLVEKLAAIETAISNGFASQSEAQDLIKQALESLNGTLEDKLVAIEEAISNQTTSLEAKLGLIEAAVDGGFADQAAAQDLIKQAIDSLSGTMADKLAAIKEAITSQTTSLESKLALIETAINNGFADQADALGLIQEAVESLEGTVEEKLAAIETAVNNQTTSLETKLGLIEASINSGFTNQEQALGLIKGAVLTLKDSGDGLDDALDDVIDAIDGVADTIGDTNDALDDIADALNDIIDSIDGLPNYYSILVAIYNAIVALNTDNVLEPMPGLSGPFGGMYLSPGYLRHTGDGYSISGDDQLLILKFFKNESIGGNTYYYHLWSSSLRNINIGGFVVPSMEQWLDIVGTTRKGATVNGIKGKHYAKVTVNLVGSDYETYGNTIKGLLLFPDNAVFYLQELLSLNIDNVLDNPADNFSVTMTYDRLMRLCGEAYCCAFLPCAGYYAAGWEWINFGVEGNYWATYKGGSGQWSIHVNSGYVNNYHLDYRTRCPIRMIIKFN